LLAPHWADLPETSPKLSLLGEYKEECKKSQ
jgi:hypothetical protein